MGYQSGLRLTSTKPRVLPDVVSCFHPCTKLEIEAIRFRLILLRFKPSPELAALLRDLSCVE
jgi:hypothetical protein